MQKRKEEEAAVLLTGRASTFLAKRAVESARVHREARDQDKAAACMQAHQRRRMEQRKLDAKRQDAMAPKSKGATIFATGKRAPTSRHLQPAPPPTKRVGGGFSRQRVIAQPQVILIARDTC